MQLIIAEKPSQARTICTALGLRGRSVDGAIITAEKTITWCIGHLASLAMPEDYDPTYKNWRWQDLPIIPEKTILMPGQSTINQWQVVQRLLTSNQFSEVINATDSGREGELIFDNVYRLSGSQIPVYRLWTASLTDEAIQNAFANLKPASQYFGLRDAARCRAEADWLIGLNATRLETLSAKAIGKNDGVYPVGRVQTPTLAMIVHREKEITHFVPKDYWTIECDFLQDTYTYKGLWFKGDHNKFDNEADAKAIIEKISQKPGIITTLEEKEEKQKSQLLYDLTTLQREANIRFGYTAEQTLNYCQSLYETHKIISYPRTSSRYLTKNDSKEVPPILDKLKSITAYKPLIEGKKHSSIPARFVDDSKVEDHHAIIPTGQLPNSSISVDEKKIFDMIFRRTLAAFYPDRIDFVSKIETKVEGEMFKTRGRIIREQGWWAINPTSSKDDTDILLPPISKELPVTAESGKLKKGATTPPARFTEASLLKKMETAGREIKEKDLREALKDSGLGTPATRASIIENLKNRKLIYAKGKSLIPSEKGIGLIEQIPDGPLKSPIMTGEWEKKLNLMAKNLYSREVFMNEIKALTTELTITRKSQLTDLEIKHQSIGDCPKCQHKILLKKFNSFNYVKCSNNKCSLMFNSDEHGNPNGGTCPKKECNGPVHKTKNGFLRCTLCESWLQITPFEIIGPCPRCQNGKLELKNFKGVHYAKCITCPAAFDTNDKGIPVGGYCSTCNSPMKMAKDGRKFCFKCKITFPTIPIPHQAP